MCTMYILYSNNIKGMRSCRAFVSTFNCSFNPPCVQNILTTDRASTFDWDRVVYIVVVFPALVGPFRV